MISTVTISTISTITTITTTASIGIAATLSIVATIALIALLTAKELIGARQGGSSSSICKYLNVGIAPLLMVFCVVVAVTLTAVL